MRVVRVEVRSSSSAAASVAGTDVDGFAAATTLRMDLISSWWPQRVHGAVIKF